MPDLQEVFRMSTQKVKPDPGALERQHTRQRRRSVGKKVGAFALAAAFGLAIGWLRSRSQRAAPTIRPSGGASRRRSGTGGGCEGRSAETGSLLPRLSRNRSAATPMSPRRSAADDRGAAAVNNTAIDEKETRGG